MTNNMKNQSSNNNNSNKNNNSPKDYSWNHVYNSQISYALQEDYITNGFSWPPRSYSCSFCKREFRSAQALGGHMNVHRKDRARLRQSPPRDLGRYTGGTTFLNPNPNPNPNFSPSLITTPLSSFTSPPLSSFPSSPYSAYCPNNEAKKWPWSTSHTTDQLDPLTINGGSDSVTNVKNKQSVCAAGEHHDHNGFAGKTMYCKSLKKAAHETSTAVRLDLEIGLLGPDSKMGRDLDLELRLGYSN
ncbi:hypothetical protein TIFTF001_022619 [Ficus carica]|uniref:C2H2-type domain-containing protein n=1 Tax=Ficus carica TaxID=3494 RepID=A0AA88AI51_FICCA|nr:hypothetical protein TIFTF001_022619 [Ficus carica]